MGLTIGFGVHTVTPAEAAGETLTSAAAALPLLRTETTAGVTARSPRHMCSGSHRSSNLKLLGPPGGGTPRWFTSGRVCMLRDLLRVRLAALEGRHGWEAPDGDKSPGWSTRPGGKHSSTVTSSSNAQLTRRLKTRHSKTLDEGGRVGHRHGAVEWYGQQLVCGHGNAVWVDAVVKGAVGQAQKVQLSVSQMFPENCRRDVEWTMTAVVWSRRACAATYRPCS